MDGHALDNPSAPLVDKAPRAPRSWIKRLPGCLMLIAEPYLAFLLCVSILVAALNVVLQIVNLYLYLIVLMSWLLLAPFVILIHMIIRGFRCPQHVCKLPSAGLVHIFESSTAVFKGGKTFTIKVISALADEGSAVVSQSASPITFTLLRLAAISCALHFAMQATVHGFDITSSWLDLAGVAVTKTIHCQGIVTKLDYARQVMPYLCAAVSILFDTWILASTGVLVVDCSSNRRSRCCISCHPGRLSRQRERADVLGGLWRALALLLVATTCIGTIIAAQIHVSPWPKDDHLVDDDDDTAFGCFGTNVLAPTPGVLCEAKPGGTGDDGGLRSMGYGNDSPSSCASACCRDNQCAAWQWSPPWANVSAPVPNRSKPHQAAICWGITDVRARLNWTQCVAGIHDSVAWPSGNRSFWPTRTPAPSPVANSHRRRRRRFLSDTRRRRSSSSDDDTSPRPAYRQSWGTCSANNDVRRLRNECLEAAETRPSLVETSGGDVLTGYTLNGTRVPLCQGFPVALNAFTLEMYAFSLVLYLHLRGFLFTYRETVEPVARTVPRLPHRLWVTAAVAVAGCTRAAGGCCAKLQEYLGTSCTTSRSRPLGRKDEGLPPDTDERNVNRHKIVAGRACASRDGALTSAEGRANAPISIPCAM